MLGTRSLHIAVGLASLALAFVWAIIRSGFTMTPVPDDLRDAALAWPERLDSWMTAFYTDSPLYILAYRGLGMDSAIDVVRLGFWTSLIALIVVTSWMVATIGTDQRWRAGRLLLLSPVVAVLYITIGSYDPFTVLAWGAALWTWKSGRRVVAVLGGVLLGLQHFEQTIMGALALLLTWYAVGSQLPPSLKRISPIWLVPGIALGKLGLILLLVSQGQSALGRTGWLEQYLTEWTKVTVATLPYLIWSLFAGLWIIVVLVLLRTENLRARLLITAGIAIGVFATLISGDRPRVFVLVLLPTLCLLIIAYLRRDHSSPVETTAVETIAWLAPPIMLTGTVAVNANIYDDSYVAFFWITGLG